MALSSFFLMYQIKTTIFVHNKNFGPIQKKNPPKFCSNCLKFGQSVALNIISMHEQNIIKFDFLNARDNIKG